MTYLISKRGPVKAKSLQSKRKGQYAITKNSKQCKITENNTENFDFDIEERKIALRSVNFRFVFKKLQPERHLPKLKQ